MRGFDDCPLCLGSGAQCEPCQNRRLLAADEHTRLWSDEITGKGYGFTEPDRLCEGCGQPAERHRLNGPCPTPPGNGS